MTKEYAKNLKMVKSILNKSNQFKKQVKATSAKLLHYNYFDTERQSKLSYRPSQSYLGQIQ